MVEEYENHLDKQFNDYKSEDYDEHEDELEDMDYYEYYDLNGVDDYHDDDLEYDSDAQHGDLESEYFIKEPAQTDKYKADSKHKDILSEVIDILSHTLTPPSSTMSTTTDSSRLN